MKNVLLNILLILLVLAVVGAYAYTAYKPVWQFDHLEQIARRAISASEVQAWATNLLAHYTNETSVSLSELGTNFPPRLRNLAPKLGPSVFIHAGGGTNWPPYIRLYWGSGFLGAHGIEVGSTDFIGYRGNRLWQPGVYFY
jgi:hypothetical protein